MNETLPTVRLTAETTEVQVNDKYVVRIDPGPVMIVKMGCIIGSPAESFDHPNLLSKQQDWFEFKHYCKSGRKFWTGKAGVEFSFAIPKDKIEVVLKEGMSYVPVIIDGKVSCTLNVSGGTFPPGWVDMVHTIAATHCNGTIKQLKALAEAALTPEQFKALGIEYKVRALRPTAVSAFREYVAKMRLLEQIGKAGEVVYLANGYTTFSGGQGPLTVESKYAKRQSVIALDGASSRIRVTYAAIDWLKTAEARGIVVPHPESMNRVGPVLDAEAA